MRQDSNGPKQNQEADLAYWLLPTRLFALVFVEYDIHTLNTLVSVNA
jgi:hypothetical protein